jgi:hypothetical protein
MADRFSKNTIMLESPAGDFFSITPADATTFTQTTRALFVGTGGNIKIMGHGKVANTVITLTNVPSGALLPIRVQRVYSGNTTASGLVGLY